MSAPLRVGIVGARRIRQGLGPFLARDFEAAGHRVVSVLGRSAESAALGAADVEARTGSAPRAFHDRDAFLASGLDAVVVATPAGTHGAEVRAALEAGHHVLAEKPLLWHPEREGERSAAELEDLAHARGVTLAANAQWPWVLPAFAELFGLELDALRVGARTLRMGLAPASVGRQMIGDALPHPLSVAQALRPGLENATEVTYEARSADRMVVRARLVGAEPPLDVEVELDGSAGALPRRAWLEIDGARAERCVRPRDYALFLRDGPRLFDLPDPLGARVEAFAAAAVRGPAPAPDRTLSRRARMLNALDAAFAGSA
ncbi:MAG: Gfo/Idh/MocA family oxidoreductase [Planctomycetota bacterium]